MNVLACYFPNSLDTWYVAAKVARVLPFTRIKDFADEANDELYFHLKKVYPDLVFFLVKRDKHIKGQMV